MNKIELKFEYSLKTEIERVENTLKKLKWYEKNGYGPDLPKDIQDVKNSVAKEYDGDFFEKEKVKIESSWQKYAEDLPKKFAQFGLKFQPFYLIRLTKYGVKGSYNYPNFIVLNLQARAIEDVIRTIVHEIIHLSIENLIIKYNIPHWQKERLVFLIFDKIYPEINKGRDFPGEDKSLDGSFHKYFPDIEQVFKNR